MQKIAAKSLLILGMVLYLGWSDASAQHLTIYTESIYPVQYLDQNGKPRGYTIELFEAIQKQAGNQDPILFFPWKRAYTAATDPRNNNIVLFATTFTEQRRDLFKWVGPIAASSWVFYAKQGSGVTVNSLEGAKHAGTIGCYLGDAREQFLIKRGFNNLESVRDNTLNLHKLMAGRIALWITSDQTGMNVARQLNIDPELIKPVFKIKTFGLYIAFHKNTADEIVKRWQAAYEELMANGELEKIYIRNNQSIPDHKIPPRP